MNRSLQREAWQYTARTQIQFPFDSRILFFRISLRNTGKSMKMIWKNICVWCWRRLLRVPWTTSKSNQSNLKKINPEHSLKGLLQKLKLQNFGHLLQRASWLEKTLMLGKINGRKSKGWQRRRWMVWCHYQLNEHEFEQTLWETVKNREAWCSAVHGVSESNSA